MRACLLLFCDVPRANLTKTTPVTTTTTMESQSGHHHQRTAWGGDVKGKRCEKENDARARRRCCGFVAPHPDAVPKPPSKKKRGAFERARPARTRVRYSPLTPPLTKKSRPISQKEESSAPPCVLCVRWHTQEEQTKPPVSLSNSPRVRFLFESADLKPSAASAVRERKKEAATLPSLLCSI